MKVRILVQVGRIAGYGAVEPGALKVRVLRLDGGGRGGDRRGAGGGTEGGVLRWGMRRCGGAGAAVMARAQLLRLHLRFGAHVFMTTRFPARRRRSRPGGSPAFRRPSRDAVGLKVGAGKGEGTGGAAAAWLRCSGRAQAAGREVLVKLAHVEPVHGADDIGAELRDVHMAEVDVLAVGRGHGAVVFVGHMNFSFRSRGRRWRSVRMAWTEKSQRLTKQRKIALLKCCISISPSSCVSR